MSNIYTIFLKSGQRMYHTGESHKRALIALLSEAYRVNKEDVNISTLNSASNCNNVGDIFGVVLESDKSTPRFYKVLNLEYLRKKRIENGMQMGKYPFFKSHGEKRKQLGYILLRYSGL